MKGNLKNKLGIFDIRLCRLFLMDLELTDNNFTGWSSIELSVIFLQVFTALNWT